MKPETFQKLGEYDHFRSYIYLANHHTPDHVTLTRIHEEVHQDLSVRSSYGILCRNVKLASFSSKSKEERGDHLALLDHLIKHSRLTQEAAALYVSHTEANKAPDFVESPGFYADALKRTIEAINCIPSGNFLRARAAKALARLALCTAESFDEMNAYERPDPARIYELLPSHKMPDARFLCFFTRLQEIDRQRILDLAQKYFRAEELACGSTGEFLSPKESYREQINALTGFEGRTSNFLCVLLVDAFPDIEKGISTYRMHKGSQQALEALLKRRDLPEEPEASYLQELSDPCFLPIGLNLDDRIKTESSGCPPRPSFLENTPAIRDEIVSVSLQRGGVVYLYYPRCQYNDPVVFIAASPTGRRDKMPFYFLSDSDAELMEKCGVPKVALVEEEAFFGNLDRWSREAYRIEKYFLKQRVFVHISGSGIPFIHYVKSRKCCLKCSYFVFGYDSRKIPRGIGMYLCIYWLEEDIGDSQCIFFNVATERFVEGLIHYEREISKDGLFSIRTELRENEEILRELGKLGDHPVFNYYLNDEVPSFPIVTDSPPYERRF